MPRAVRRLPPGRAWLLLPLLACSCATPPRDAYSTSGGQAASGAISLGTNVAGEPCTQNGTGPGQYVIYCGTWKSPSARLQTLPAPPGSTAALPALATSSPWRRSLDNNFECGAATGVELQTGPALLMHCTRLLEGFPQIAFAALVGDKVWLADGVPAASAVMERAIALDSGRASSAGLGSVVESPGLAAVRLASRAASAGDLNAFDEALRKAGRANLEGDYAAAEDAYRATLAVQRRVLGPDAPDTARTLALQALQVSDLHRYGEANAMLARAEQLAAPAGISEESALPLVWHYEGLNLLNQNKPRQALALLKRAEQVYLRTAPAATADAGSTDDLLPTDRITAAAALGVVETQRAQAIAYRMLGDTAHATREARMAAASLRNAHLHSMKATARILRTQASVQDAAGQEDAALGTWVRAADQFAKALPGSRPFAETQLLLAGQLIRDGQTKAALAACGEAQHVLRGAAAGVTADKLAPCLDLLAAHATQGDQDAARDMFTLAEEAQGGTTSQQIALVSARLAENKRDPKVARLIRDRDDANAALSNLYAAHEDAAPNSPQATDLARQIAAAEHKRDTLEESLQSASPNYGQLVQQAVSADDIMRALRPGEAFANIVLGSHAGWVFLLRDNRIAVGTVAGGATVIDPLVRRIRTDLDEPAQTGGLRPFDTEAAATLYADLFGGVTAPLAGATALTVAPSGTLLSLPFGLLLTGPARPDALADAPWLIRKLVIAHVPAPANFVQLRHLAGTSRADKPWFGFGNFIPVSQAQAAATFPPATCRDSAALFGNLPPLPGATLELDTTRRLLGAAGEDELLGRNFTADKVESIRLQEYRVLHFATHALLQTDLACQAEPALVASAPANAANAAGALLTASRVAGLKLDADAVLLSACNTGGAGGSAPGESLSGLARSFFYAGARALLITHWDVNDKVMAVLVGATLAHAQEEPGLGMAGALARAQRELLAKAHELPNLAHPFYWAPLALIGDGTSGLGEKVAG